MLNETFNSYFQLSQLLKPRQTLIAKHGTKILPTQKFQYGGPFKARLVNRYIEPEEDQAYESRKYFRLPEYTITEMTDSPDFNKWYNKAASNQDLIKAIQTVSQMSEFSDMFAKYDQNGGFTKFLIGLAGRESGGNQTIVNPYGYSGWFQMNKKYIPAYTSPGVSQQQYLNDPNLQVQGVLRMMKEHLNNWNRRGHLVKGADPYSLSGRLAATHLIGFGGLKSKGFDHKDAYGTSGAYYGNLFNNLF